ncbi:MAG: peptide deformylase [Proteobacteria bacterium]|nr:peptide deformylase [Pseudomonadota bacterium]
MALLEIIKHPDPLLRRKSEDIDVFDEALRKTLQSMLETMHEAGGIGLAGVQVAFMKRALVIDIGHVDESQDSSSDQEVERENRRDRKKHSKPEFYLNPEIIKHEGDTEYEEGCLSIPGVYGMVKRSAKVTVKYQDEFGSKKEIEASDLRAIVLQHEIDHLNGVLFFDHLNALSRSILLAKYKKNQK